MLCVLSGVCLCEVCAQRSVCKVGAVSGVCLCEVSALCSGAVSNMSQLGVCTMECVFVEYCLYMWCVHCVVCVW